ncbi:putative ABC-type transport system periplasmic component/surface lipoprotein [Rubrobacter radiotolerans]|uniref:Putative ABC-type transport system periplasmic component/surface lipoprotein n=1 Tax=Rubrobacter radiotolerans TaxID=42256 RepID=A0A023X046_RUBRA|nr:putative ABC-type transport system periplasmic component/surface lipoprotein [Rubrobacter radiotolerans]SMC02528.1 nucleoside-binding protein [Rubrobacter radiotolerans DSM 5868]
MRRFGLVFSVVAAFSLAAGCGGGESGGGEDTGGGGGEAETQAALVLDVGGLGDQSFNDSAYAGLQRANEDFGTGEEYLESSAPTDYVNNLTQLSDNGFSPIFAVGFLMTDALTEVAPQYPDTNFAIVDSVVEGQPNVASLVFREQEGSYLAGVAAGLMTQEETEFTNEDLVVGFLGGQESDLIAKFEAGYVAGVESVCSECEVLVQYAGTTPEAFNDPARGSEIARQQRGQGADIIYHAAGATGAGLFDVATEENFFAIGVDADQAQLVPDAPILTSVVKRVDNAVYDAIEQANNGEFPGGEVVEFGLKDGGLSLAPFGEYDDLVPQEVKDQIAEAEQGIIDGEIEVPDTPQ